MPKSEARLIYEKKEIRLDDILAIAFQSAGTNSVHLVKKGRNAMDQLIGRSGRMEIGKFAKAADYDYKTPFDKYIFRKRFLQMLYNIGLIKLEYNEDPRLTHVIIDDRFLKLFDIFEKKWRKKTDSMIGKWGLGYLADIIEDKKR